MSVSKLNVILAGPSQSANTVCNNECQLQSIPCQTVILCRTSTTVKIARNVRNIFRVVKDLTRFVEYFGPAERQTLVTDKMPNICDPSLVPAVSPQKLVGPQKRPFIVSIEGNIGAGKSTMLKFFEKYNDVELIPEPVSQWCDVKGHNLLAKLYEDPKRWSFQFQSYVQLTRLELLKKPTKSAVKIIERSIQNNRYCFLENAKKEGSLCGAELEVLTAWYDWLNNNVGIPLDLIVYLRTSPEVAYQRLRERGRKEEAGVPMAFIESLHQSYEDWLIHKTQGPLPAPVMVLDADQGIEQMIATYDQYKDEIRGKRAYKDESNDKLLNGGAVKCLRMDNDSGYDTDSSSSRVSTT